LIPRITPGDGAVGLTLTLSGISKQIGVPAVQVAQNKCNTYSKYLGDFLENSMTRDAQQGDPKPFHRNHTRSKELVGKVK
jgi:hypothetical protein